MTGHGTLRRRHRRAGPAARRVRAQRRRLPARSRRSTSPRRASSPASSPCSPAPTSTATSSRRWVDFEGGDSGRPFRVLADGDVRFAGEPVALVVAESRYVAEDACDLVEVEIDPVDADHRPRRRAGRRGPSACTRSGPTTSPGRSRRRRPGARRGLRRRRPRRHRDVPPAPLPVRADGVPRGRLDLGRVPQRAARAHLDPGRPRRSRVPVAGARAAGEPGPGRDAGRRRRVRAEDVHARPTRWRSCSPASASAGPVKWIEDRRENLMAGQHARDDRMTVSFALDADGRILGVRAELVEDVGAFPAGGQQRHRLRRAAVHRGRTRSPRSGSRRRPSTPTRADAARTAARG